MLRQANALIIHFRLSLLDNNGSRLAKISTPRHCITPSFLDRSWCRRVALKHLCWDARESFKIFEIENLRQRHGVTELYLKYGDASHMLSVTTLIIFIINDMQKCKSLVLKIDATAKQDKASIRIDRSDACVFFKEIYSANGITTFFNLTFNLTVIVD